MDTTELENILRIHEGYDQFAYPDSLGYVTIGVGRCIDRRIGKGISKKEAAMLLKNDIDDCKHELEPFVFYQQLDNVRKCVLIELVFNMGLHNLLQFKHTLDAIKKHNYALASMQLRQSKWAKEVGRTRVNNICYRLRYGFYPHES